MSAAFDDPLIAAREGAAFIWVSQPGYLRLYGEDRQAFLQRQTTNDIDLLQEDRALASVLTSPTGRILDVFDLLHEPDSIGIVTLPGRGLTTYRYLRSRIFFMDKVSLVDVSADFSQLFLFGPKSGEALARLGCSIQPAENQVIHVPYQKTDLVLWGHVHELGIGVMMLAPVVLRESITTSLVAVGGCRLTDEEYQIIRIENGDPSVNSELAEEFTPLEVGLGGLVATQKGCYTGQEVLARQINYEKVTQRLVGLNLQTQTSTGERLWSEDDRPAGMITSYVFSPRFGPIALAVVKRPFDQPGTTLHLGNPEAVSQTVTVTNLPFNR